MNAAEQQRGNTVTAVVAAIAVAVAAAAIIGVAGGYMSMRVALAKQSSWSESLSRRTESLERSQALRVAYLQSIDSRLSRIEGALKIPREQ